MDLFRFTLTFHIVENSLEVDINANYVNHGSPPPGRLPAQIQ